MSERDQQKPEDPPEDPKDLPVQPDLATAPHIQATGADVALDPELQAFIGRQLMATFDEVVNEPVPDRFLELLRQLDSDSSAVSVSHPGKSSADKAGKQ